MKTMNMYESPMTLSVMLNAQNAILVGSAGVTGLKATTDDNGQLPSLPGNGGDITL